MSTPLTELLLERYALGEVTAEEKRVVESELATSAEARARLEAIETSTRELLARYPAGRMADAIRMRARGPGRSWSPRLLVAVPALAAAATLFVALNPGEQTGGEVTRAKGLHPTLFVHRQTDEGSERLDDGDVATEHDVLQLSYLAAGRERGAIVSIDGRGTVTLHHPPTVDGDTTLLPAGEAALPRAYELDDAPSFERFFLVTTPLETHAALDAASVLEAARELTRDLERARAAPLPLPEKYEQTSVLVAKYARDP